MIIALVGLLLAVGATFFFFDKGEGESSGGSSTSYVPIFAAVFIPLLAMRAKKLNPKQRKLLQIIVAVGVITLVLGLAVFFFYAKS